MRLTRFTDYSLRVLIYLGLSPGRATIPEITAAYGISRNHLLKVVRALADAGYITTRQGKGGGIALARPPAEIGIGEVVRDTEETLAPAECMRPGGEPCRIGPDCRLAGVFREAQEGFLATLDRYTLADLLAPGTATLLGLGPAGGPSRR